MNQVRSKNIQANHQSVNRKVLKITGVRHQSLNNKPFPLFKNRHQDMANKQQRQLKSAHRSMEGKRPPLFQNKHKSTENYTYRSTRILHKDLSGEDPFKPLRKKQINPAKRSNLKDMANACYPRFRLKHKEMSEVCNQKVQIRHRDMTATCEPAQVNHKDLGSVCGPKIKFRHKDLQSKCYPAPLVKHKNLSAECMPKYRVKHTDMGDVCYLPGKVKHKSLSTMKCYPTVLVRHKNMEGLSCTEREMVHFDPAKFKIPCDPNMQQPTSTMERIGKELKYYFTYHRRYCELEARYSGVTEGCVVETTHGTAVVTDIIVKKDLIYPTNMEVAVADVRKGEATVKIYKIDKVETKEIMLRELIKRQKYIWLVRMYPEERTNLDNLRKLYGDPSYKDPNAGPPPPSPIDTEGN